MSTEAQHVFVVLGAQDPDTLKSVIPVAWKEDERFELPSGDWLVASSSELVAPIYDRIKAAAGTDVTCVVTRLDTYYGWHDRAVWDWIEVHRRGKQ